MTRVRRSIHVATILGVATLAAGAAQGHHSQQPFFHMDRDIVISGVVTAVDFVNPHPIIYIEVKDGDETVEWQVEGPTPIYLRRTGWTETSVVAGDSVSVRGAPPKKDGAHILAGRELRKADDTVLRLYTDDASSVLELGR